MAALLVTTLLWGTSNVSSAGKCAAEDDTCSSPAAGPVPVPRLSLSQIQATPGGLPAWQMQHQGVPLVITGLGPRPCSEAGWIEQLGAGLPAAWAQAVAKEPGGQGWAGLRSAETVEVAQLARYIGGMGAGSNKRWAEVRIGGAGTPEVDVLRQDVRSLLRTLGLLDVLLEPEPKLRAALPRVPSELFSGYPNLYVASNGTQTVTHVDRDHSAFLTFMCKGGKRWRVLPFEELRKVVKKAKPSPIARARRHNMADPAYLRYPTDQLPDLHDVETFAREFPEVRFFETTVGEGEALYVPQGTAHAGESVGESFMITHNFIDSSACGAARSYEFWAHVCGHRPSRIVPLFSARDRKSIRSKKARLAMCESYVEFLKEQVDAGGCVVPASAGESVISL